MKCIALVISCSFILIANRAIAVEENERMPVCDVIALEDEKIQLKLQQFIGQVIYLDFWASWCVPCAKSFPYMNYLEKAFNKQGLKIIAINLDEDINDAHEFLVKVPAKFTLAFDSKQQCAKAFNVQAMPSTYIIDKQGVVRHIHLGFRDGETDKLQMVIEQLLAE